MMKMNDRHQGLFVLAPVAGLRPTVRSIARASGVAPATLARYLGGIQAPRPSTLRKLAIAFGVTSDVVHRAFAPRDQVIEVRTPRLKLRSVVVAERAREADRG